MRNIKINITYDCVAIQRFYVSRIIKQCIEAVLREEKIHVPCEINILVTNDCGIQQINNACRNIDRPTDVLSFPMFEFSPGDYPDNWENMIDPETQLCPLGDMAISLERAILQAKEFGHSIKREIGYLTIHSMLHLLGYDHVDEAEMKVQMRAREEAIAKTIPGMNR